MPIKQEIETAERTKKYMNNIPEQERNTLVGICEYFDLFNLGKFSEIVWQNYIESYSHIIEGIQILDDSAEKRFIKGMYVRLGGTEIAEKLGKDMERRIIFYDKHKKWPNLMPDELEKLFAPK